MGEYVAIAQTNVSQGEITVYEKIFERVDLSTLAESLLYGVYNDNPTNASCEQRMKAIESELTIWLDAYLEPGTSEDAQAAFFQLLAMANAVYFELGMKAGARLNGQLLEESPVM